MADQATADCSSIDEENRCINHFSAVADQDLKPFSEKTWRKVLSAAEIWSKTEGERGDIAQDFLAFVNAHSRSINSRASTSSDTDSVRSPIPTQTRFHQPCYSKFTDKNKLRQDHEKWKRPQDTENAELDGKL